MSIVRVREGVQCTTFDHRNQTFVSLAPGIEFDSDDPFVKENAWAFETDADADARPDRKSRARRTSAPLVEDASAEPGRKRA